MHSSKQVYERVFEAQQPHPDPCPVHPNPYMTSAGSIYAAVRKAKGDVWKYLGDVMTDIIH